MKFIGLDLSVLDPVRVAEDYATLDHLSGGRVELAAEFGDPGTRWPRTSPCTSGAEVAPVLRRTIPDPEWPGPVAEVRRRPAREAAPA